MLVHLGYGLAMKRTGIKLSEKLSSWLCEIAELEGDYMFKFVAYFIRMAWFQVYETAIIWGIAYLFGIFPQVLLSMIGFLPVRMSAKGKHADTKLKCVLYSTSLFLTLGYIGSYFNWIVCIIFGIISAFLLREKVDNKHKV